VTETRTLHGRWRLPDQALDRAIRGTLTLSDDAFHLDLEGSLHRVPEDGPSAYVNYQVPTAVDRILGETTEGVDVTLETCTLRKHGTRGTRRRPGVAFTEAYRPRIVCVGAWFGADEELAFDIALVRLSSLHPWTAVSGFEPVLRRLPDEHEPTTLTYTPPPTRTATLQDGTVVALEFPLVDDTRGLYPFERTLRQATRFELRYPEARDVVGVQTHIQALRNLLTLGVGQPVKVVDVVAYRKPVPNEEPALGREVEVLYAHTQNASAQELPHHHDMVFLLPDIADHFERHIVRWFDHARELGRVLDLYFSTLDIEFMYLETKFMNFAQAIEGYHRRRLNRTTYDDETFAGYKGAILEPLSGKARELAKRALRYANEVSLESRIKDVIDGLGPPARNIVGAANVGTQDFANRAAKIRNVYAHNLDDEEPELRELAVLTFQLNALVEAILLSEVGFDPDVIDAKLRNADRYRRIEALASPS
jgi:ApeA N-terminal domain 1